MSVNSPLGAHRDPAMLTRQAGEDGDAPVYLVLRDALAEEIRTGAAGPGARLPSERDLAARFGVARMTARKALGVLESEGMIFRADRRGYFVSPPRIRYAPGSSVNLMRQLREQGLMTANHYLGRQQMGASDWLAAHLRAPVGAAIALERSVVEVEGRKIVYSEDFLRLDLLPGYAEAPYVSPMTQNIRRNYGVDPQPAWSRIRAATISSVAAQHLGVAAGTAGLTITHVQTHGGQVVMVNRCFWLSDAVDLVLGDAPEG